MHTIPNTQRLLVPVPAARPRVLAAARSARALSLHGKTWYRLDVLPDSASLDARLRGPSDAMPAAMVVELHPDGPGPVGPLVRTLTRHFPGVPLIVACTEKAPDGREVLGAARAGAELFAFPPDDDLAAIVGRIVGEPAAGENAILAPLPRLARRALGALTSHEPPPPRTVEALAACLSMKPRTMYRRMEASRWPAPGQVMIWGRLLRGAKAADAARASGDTLSAAALATAAGFRSVHRAADSYRRRAEVTLSDVRSDGVRALMPALLRAFPPRS